MVITCPSTNSRSSEVLNYTDVLRTVAEIRDAVVRRDLVLIEAVIEYLEVLARAGVVRFQE